ncbi:MAG: PKD domain-containing protein [bacterium]
MRTQATTTLVIAFVALAPLAGCIGFGGGDEATPNKAPVPELTAPKQEAWTGDDLVFDARNSTDPDGHIVTYRFDFGDGNTTTVQKGGEPKVTHAYKEGGGYAVTLTVTDDGARGAGALTGTTTVPVVINEKDRITGQALFVAPPSEGTMLGQWQRGFDVKKDAKSFELNLTLTSVLPLGSSDMVVRVLDPAGHVLAEKNLTVGPNDPQDVTLDGNLTDAGNHTIEVTARTGGATFDGDLQLYYFEPAEDEAAEAPDAS